MQRAGGKDEGQRAQALSELCQIYWPPIYGYLRARGYSSHDAEDLTQSFFERLLRGRAFDGVEEGRGRLRSYLLGALKHSLTDEFRKRQRGKRGGGVAVLRIEPAELDAISEQLDSSSAAAPDRIYDRIWAQTVLEASLQALEKRYADKGQSDLFAKLSPLLRAGESELDSATLARDLGLSPSALRVALHRLRQRYGACLREQISHTLVDEDSPEDELRELMAAFS